MNTKILIICKSIYNGNTMKLAKAMAEEVNADIISPEEVTDDMLKNYNVIGIGSAIIFTRHHPSIFEFIERSDLKDKRVFIFSTRGNIFLGKYHEKVKKLLQQKQAKIIGEFSTPAYDCTGPFTLLKGVNKGRPNELDIEKCKKFINSLGIAPRSVDYFKEKLLTENGSIGEIKVYKSIDKRYNVKLVGTKVSVDWEKCTGCGICTNACPLEVFVLGGDENRKVKSLPKGELDCIRCNCCVKKCPNKAISTHGNWTDGFRVAWRHRNR